MPVRVVPKKLKDLSPEERVFEMYRRQPEKMLQKKKKPPQMDKNVQGLYPNMYPNWDKF